MKRFGWSHLIAVGVLALAVVVRIGDPGPLQVLRHKVFDLYQQIQPRQITPQPVVIVDLDEESLAAHGQWPWPRTLVAELVQKLHQAGVPAVAFDVVFAEPDRTSPDRLGQILSELDPETAARLERLPNNDQVFAETLRRGRVVLGQSTTSRPTGTAAERKSVKTSFAVKGARGVEPRRFIHRYADLVRNLPVLEDAAAGIGVFTLMPSADGIVRRVPLVARIGEQLYPALTLELLRVATNQRSMLIKTNRAGIEAIVVAGQEVPTDRNGQLWVRYSPHSRDRYVSAKDVLSGAVGPERLTGHLALIGTSAVGLLDIKATPLDDAMPGVEVHAQLLETILSGSYLERPNWTIGAELVGLAAVGLLVIALVPFLGALYTLLFGFAALAGLIGGSWYLFAAQGLLLDMAYAAIAVFIVYAVLTYLNYAREERERRQVRGAFSRYMSPELVARLAEDPSRLKLGGEQRDMTLLFADIRGFTTISEQFDAAGLTRFINRFLTPMTNLILQRKGTIDKYMGDCIMAFWNAPLDDPDHAKNGVRSALEMRAGLSRLNAELETEAEAEQRPFIPVHIGIGLNSGTCCVGNMGSDLRFDYSVLGDNVNLASRLEGQSKTYGVDIVIGENTFNAVRDFAVLQLDRIQVKGKTVPVDIYGVLGDDAEAASPAFAELRARHEEMLTAYWARDWATMRRLLGACRGLNNGYGLEAYYRLYAERLNAFEAASPGADWDGVFVATSK